MNKFFLAKLGQISQGVLTTTIAGTVLRFISTHGHQAAEGQHQHEGIDIHVTQVAPLSIPAGYYVFWRDINGWMWAQSENGRWWWNGQVWCPG